jgi:hypothetical protein
MRRALLALVTLALIEATGAQAHSAGGGGFTVLGIGNKSCGSWVSDSKSKNGADLVNEAWVLGFLSAYNEFGPEPDDVTAQTDVNGVAGWIDNYCTGHPLDTVSLATQALINELNRRRK